MQRARIWFVAAGLGLSLSCHAGKATPAEYEKRGDAFMTQQQVAEAVIEYRNAKAGDPRSGVIRQKLAAAYARAGNSRAALGEWIDAADLLPSSVDAQIQAGRALLLSGQFDDAKGRADRALALDPKSIDAQILRGNALAALKDLDGAIAQVESAIRADPSRSVGYANLATLQYAKGNAVEAEAMFQKAIAAEPNSVAARLALANLYWASGRLPQAESTIRDALKIEPANVLANRALAVFCMSANRAAEAEAPLKILADKMPGAEGKLALADYYASVQRTNDAKTILDALVKNPASATDAKLRLATIGLTTGDRDGASRLVGQILKTDPKNSDALIANARLEILESKNADAVATARAAVASAPDSPQAQYALGQAFGANGQGDDAKHAYAEALRLNSRYAPASLELGRISLAEGRPKDAVTFAESALNSLPGYADAYLLLARAEIAAGQPRLAEEPLQALTAEFPNKPEVQAETGRLQLAEGDLAGGRASLERALAGNPVQLDALAGLTALDFRAKQTGAVRARLDAALEKAPKNVPLQVLASRAYIELGDNAGAERLLKEAIVNDANNLEAYDVLARLYVKERRLAEATTEFQALADRQPKAIAPRTAVAILMQLQNRWSEAQARYEEALAIDPRAAVAANNLAQIYADRNGNLDIALQLAKSAKAVLPTVSEIDDTLGYIYLKKNLLSLAVASLKECVAADPKNPLYQYHLALAYVQTGNKTEARDLLERALKTGTTFDGADNARTVLKSLKG